MNNPIARKDKLVVQEMPDEVLVYDLNTHKAHCLNLTAAFVWNHCDGQFTVAEIANLLAQKKGTSISEEVVWLALKQLEKASLLQSPFAQPENGIRFSRREALRRWGAAAALSLPLVTSIVSPVAAAAASACPATCQDKGSQAGDCTMCQGGQLGNCYANNGCGGNGGGNVTPNVTCSACLSLSGAHSWECTSGC